MTSQRTPYFVVDAFTSRPFCGNPAAVVPLESPRDDAWMQSVAMEMNLAETAFLHEESGGWRLRWFTPAVEVDLCGHATIATAAVLAELGTLADGAEVSFATRSGRLGTRREGSRYVLDFPALEIEPATASDGLLEALGIDGTVGRSRFDYIVEVDSADIVRTVAPDLRRLAAIECRGVIVTARGDGDDVHFVSRFFAPAAGIDEDPVTGSAHCVLAPYWSERLGRARMTGHQLSRRGGIVEVELRGDRVLLGGDAVIVASGELRV